MFDASLTKTKVSGKGHGNIWSNASLLRASFPRPRWCMKNIDKLVKRKGELWKEFRASMAASTGVLGEPKDSSHGYVSKAKMGVAATHRRAVIDNLRSLPNQPKRCVGIIQLDEAETPISTERAG